MHYHGNTNGNRTEKESGLKRARTRLKLLHLCKVAVSTTTWADVLSVCDSSTHKTVMKQCKRNKNDSAAAFVAPVSYKNDILFAPFQNSSFQNWLKSVNYFLLVQYFLFIFSTNTFIRYSFFPLMTNMHR